MTTRVQIWTDGACSGNPGKGGWGAILCYGDVEKEIAGGEKLTTNNRMELMAAISALEALTRRGTPVPQPGEQVSRIALQLVRGNSARAHGPERVGPF